MRTIRMAWGCGSEGGNGGMRTKAMTKENDHLSFKRKGKGYLARG
jgi:hypothetical protein